MNIVTNFVKETKLLFNSLKYGFNVRINNDYRIYNTKVNQNRKIDIIGITRIRNEELVIDDTLKHMAEFVDAFIVLDDCSCDRTCEIVIQNKKVIELLRNRKWKEDRVFEETYHRQMLLDEAKRHKPSWIFYFDADERFEGDIRKELSLLNSNVDGIRIRLFDAYMTDEDKFPFKKGNRLYNYRKFFGPEQRNILMLWRNKPYIRFEGLDSREPVGCKNIVERFYCQHYGKSISEEQWEETCEYYEKYFPEPYKSKWTNRKGKAIHAYSDFGRVLYTWNEVKDKGEILQ